MSVPAEEHRRPELIRSTPRDRRRRQTRVTPAPQRAHPRMTRPLASRTCRTRPTRAVARARAVRAGDGGGGRSRGAHRGSARRCSSESVAAADTQLTARSDRGRGQRFRRRRPVGAVRRRARAGQVGGAVRTDSSRRPSHRPVRGRTASTPTSGAPRAGRWSPSTRAAASSRARCAARSVRPLAHDCARAAETRIASVSTRGGSEIAPSYDRGWLAYGRAYKVSTCGRPAPTADGASTTAGRTRTAIDARRRWVGFSTARTASAHDVLGSTLRSAGRELGGRRQLSGHRQALGRGGRTVWPTFRESPESCRTAAQNGLQLLAKLPALPQPTV